MKHRIYILVAVLGVMLFALPTVVLAVESTVPSAMVDMTQDEWDVLRLTNIERAKEGIPLLVATDVMQEVVHIRSTDLEEVYSHTRPDGSKPWTALDEIGISYYLAAENIANGFFAPEAVVEAWMNSEGHRKNILNERLRFLGSGNSGRYWAQMFLAQNNIDCVAIDLDTEHWYFTLELENGTIAYAPYDIEATPIVDGTVTFDYPGTTAISVSEEWMEEVTNPFDDVEVDDYYYNPVLWALETGVTAGISDIEFAPSRTCTRAEVVTFLWRAEGCPEPETTENPFTDVSSDKYYYKPVLWAVEQGIAAGTTESTFGPMDTCTTAHVLTFLWRANGTPEAEEDNAFALTYADKYYGGAVAWADEAGFLTDTVGTGTFVPNSDGLRSHIVTYLYVGAGSPSI